MVRKREGEEEEAPFKVPEFDEREFLTKEMGGAKAAVLTVFLAVGLASAAALLTYRGFGAAGGLLAVLGVFALRPLFQAARLDVGKLDWKSWAGNGVSYFLTFLAVWVLLLNPPFDDQIAPRIHSVKIRFEGQVNFTEILVRSAQALPLGSSLTVNLTIRMVASDNERVVRAVANVTDSSGDTWSRPMTIGPDGYQGTLPLTRSLADYQLRLWVQDARGYETTFTFTVLKA